MGRRKRGRAVSGILLLDKERGISSNRALQQVRRLYDATKAGHTGSLDPLADGMLPICFGEATKLSGYLLDANKTYEVTMQLGEKTSTGDAEGEVIATAEYAGIGAGAWVQAAEAFMGPIQQIPPMYSALKHEGKRLYELARAGQEVERKPREVVIHRLEMLGVTGARVQWRVHCSKGTYVRTLVEDLAESVGTVAHVSALRRSAVGSFGDERMYSFAELEMLADAGMSALDALLMPAARALAGWQRVEMDADSSFYFRRGQAIQVPKAPPQGRVAVFGPGEQLLGLGEILPDGRVGPKRLLELERADQ